MFGYLKNGWAMIKRKYHTLAVREAGRWAPQFGDYDRVTVEGKRDGYRDKGTKARDLRIITTGDAQADIDAAVAVLQRQESA